MKSPAYSEGSEALGIQFLHPGREHGPSSKFSNKREWNRGDHARKFMTGSGRVLDSLNLKPRPAKFTFWGEWEPPSTVTGPLMPASTGGPSWLHEPYLEIPDTEGLQNTDPFVFGDSFRYTICQQHRRNGKPTILRDLPVGSVVLFGSSPGRRFVLDTVFVVSATFVDWYEESGPDEQIGSQDQHYQHATIDRLTAPANGLRLYSGATYADRARYNNLFSFAPCKLIDGKPVPFARPVLDLPGFSCQTQGYKFLSRTATDTRKLWQDVVDTVLNDPQGLSLAVRIDLPRWEGNPGVPAAKRPGRSRC